MTRGTHGVKKEMYDIKKGMYDIKKGTHDMRSLRRSFEIEDGDNDQNRGIE